MQVRSEGVCGEIYDFSSCVCPCVLCCSVSFTHQFHGEHLLTCIELNFIKEAKGIRIWGDEGDGDR